MGEVDEVPPNAGISSASQNKGLSSNDQSFKGWMGIMSAEEMEVFQDCDVRAFYKAVSSGNVTEARSVLEKNPGLARIKIQNGMLPIHVAVLRGDQKMLRYLFVHTNLDDLESEQKAHLFFTMIKNSIYDVAFAMLFECPTLAGDRDEEQLTALHLLARKLPEDSFGSRLLEDMLIGELCFRVRRMERNEMLEFISKPSSVLFDAAESGNFLILKKFIKVNPELLLVIDSKRRSLLHTAVLYRHASPFFDMIKDEMWKEHVILAVDEDGNNILHMAGRVSPHERSESSRPDIQMQRELLYFKAVEKMVPTAFKFMRNKAGQTPRDIFHTTHKELLISPRLTMMDKADYGMVVATLIATIVFAASLTVPGHDVSPEANSLILQKQQWFIVFFVSNSVALFSSSASIIFFLSILTYSYTEDELNISLQLRLMSGVTALFVAITTMVLAFTAACFLIFNHHCTWVLYLVASFGFFTVALSVFLLRTLFRDSIAFLYSSKAYWLQLRPKKSCLSCMKKFIDFIQVSALLILYHLLQTCRKIYHLLKMSQKAKANPCLHFQENNLAAEP